MADIDNIKRIKRELSKVLGCILYVLENTSDKEYHFYPLSVSCDRFLDLVEELDALSLELEVPSEVH